MYEKGIGVTRDPGRREALVPQGGAGGQRAGRAQSCGHERRRRTAASRTIPKRRNGSEGRAELGVRDSQYNLAILYARGLGVEKDLGQSWLWFSLAAQQGDADAATKRDEIAGEMDPASLAAATEALTKFKAVKPDPAANDVAAPPGGWDAKAGLVPAWSVARRPPTRLTRKRLFDQDVRRRGARPCAVPPSGHDAHALPRD